VECRATHVWTGSSGQCAIALAARTDLNTSKTAGARLTSDRPVVCRTLRNLQIGTTATVLARNVSTSDLHGTQAR
jgi:hypothetical protein